MPRRQQIGQIGRRLDLPPPYRLVVLREAGDAFGNASAHAAELGAGTLIFVGRFDVADFAVVLEPEEPLVVARCVFYAGMVALGDALAACAPPEKPIAIEWPDAIRVDGSLVGGGRLAWPDGADDDAIPHWLVFGATIHTDWPRSDDSGRYPTATALIEEGFRDARPERIAERFARHLMAATDLWQEAGFAPIAKQYLARWRPERGVCREIGDDGDLCLRAPGKPVESRALGYISWEQYEANQKLISENAHMLPRTDRKSARGGRALLTGLVRCARCGRTMRVCYGTQSGHAHRYQCRGDDSHIGSGWLCTGIGGVRIDRAVTAQIVEAVSEHAIEAAIQAANQSVKADNEIRQALCRELEEARYEAALAARRYEVVDPAKRLVARELETRWNTALECVADLEDRIARHDAAVALRPKVDRAALIALARDLPTTWNAPGTDARTKQRITHILIREVVLNRDDATNQAIVTIHWNGGRHTELRVSRVRTGRYPADRHPSPVEVIRRLGGQWPDREVAVTMNRMRCKPADGQAWTTLRVRDLRERLGIAPFDPTLPRAKTVSADEAATRLGICLRSVHKLIRKGVLPATQLMHSAPWQIPVAALDSEAVKIGVREIVGRRPKFYKRFQEDKTLRLPGF